MAVVLRPGNGEQRDGAEDGCLISERGVLRLLEQKSVVVTESVDDGDEHVVQNDECLKLLGDNDKKGTIVEERLEAL